MNSPQERLVTPFLWVVIGAGFGLFSLEVVGVPVLVASIIALGIRATGSRNTRHWADLAGLLFGAGLVGSIFALQDSLIPSCSGHTFSGGCDSNGHCWSSGPTTCTDGHLVFIAMSAASCLFMLAAVTIVVRLIARSAATRSGHDVP